MSRTVLSRGRALASLTTVLGLGLGATAVAAGPAQSDAPGIDCPTAAAAPVADQAVHGLTVTHGTTPEDFTGTVIGTLNDGIAPGVDMIMVDLSSAEIDRVGGIWQGMSGSPVYNSDNQLIGAVAYGLSWGPSPVAGVTPYPDMARYLGTTATAPATKVPVGPRAARAIAGASDVSATQAASGFSQLPMPLGVSGVSGRRLDQASAPALRKQHSWLPSSTYRMGAAAAPGAGPGADTVVAGGNLAASLSYGDVTQAGLGTATRVCDGRVVGFGHPMTFLGRTSLSLHPADALYIQKDSLGAPFKVGNLGAPVGTITDDHLTGITGSLGALPGTALIGSKVTYPGGTPRTGSTKVSVEQALPGTVFYENMANHDRVVDGITGGSELQTWAIDVAQRGQAGSVRLTGGNRFASEDDITWAASGEVADLSWLLTQVPGLSITSVDVTSAVKPDSSTYRLARLEQRVGSQWVRVGERKPVTARAGRTVRMRAVLTSGTTTRLAPFQLAVSPRMAGSMGQLYVAGSDEMWEDEGFYGPAPTSLAGVQKLLAGRVRNDQLSVTMELEGPRSMKVQHTRTAAQDKVVVGSRMAGVQVR